MTDRFEYDVFISYAPNDRAVVHALANRLHDDELEVWLDEWIVHDGPPTAQELAQGLAQSRALLVCMSPSYFGIRWGAFERQTILFRDPANLEKRFIPLMLEECQPPSTLAQFAYINWVLGDDESYLRLKEMLTAEAEGPTEEIDTDDPDAALTSQPSQIGHIGSVFGGGWLAKFALSPDGRTAVVGQRDGAVAIWDLETHQMLETSPPQEEGWVWAVALDPSGDGALTGSGIVQRWDRQNLDVPVASSDAHGGAVNCISYLPDGKRFISGSDDHNLILWDTQMTKQITTLVGHSERVWDVTVTSDAKLAVSCSQDGSIRVWDLDTGETSKVTDQAHLQDIYALALSADDKTLITGSADNTIKVWDFPALTLRATLEGHLGKVVTLAISPDGSRAISGSYDNSLKLWDLQEERLIAALGKHARNVRCVRVDAAWTRAVSIGDDQCLRIWDLSQFGGQHAGDSERYTNAKVVLVGESGVGKSGLALRLAQDDWQVTESTHGMEVYRLELPDLPASDMAREVWLWDFAGQPDYRLIHQLYMDETALALMVVDPQKDDPFAPLGHWEAALARAVKHDPARLLVAARCDRGGYMIAQRDIDDYLAGRGYSGYVNTSAKQPKDPGTDKLRKMIGDCIPWDSLPSISTTRLFKALKDAVIGIKDTGVTLIRVVELEQRLRWNWKGDPFTDLDLRTVITHLSGQGIIKPLDFGDFVLLQPEEINNYGSAVVRAARDHESGLAELPEEDVLDGEIDFKDMKRLKPSDEKILLRAMVQTFLNRGLCYRIKPEGGDRLVFPAYFRNDREEIPRQPNVVVTYGFRGPVDQIYTALIVRLHYTNTFEIDRLWRYAADFKPFAKGQAGLMLHKERDEEATIKVYFDEEVAIDTRVSFIKYIHEHLKREASEVTRVRDYACPHCNTPVENKKAVNRRLKQGKTDILCVDCEKRVPLIDLIEEKFASDEFSRHVLEMDKDAQFRLDNESLELILVGHAFTTVGESGHIFRPIPNSDWGIDGEIEFKNDEGEASGQRLYLQLKSGDSYLRHRKRDDVEVFDIKNQRHAEYWTAQEYPVMLVIRNSDGSIRWMNVTDYLNCAEEGTKQIVFDGEPFTAVSIAQKWRQTVLADV